MLLDIDVKSIVSKINKERESNYFKLIVDKSGCIVVKETLYPARIIHEYPNIETAILDYDPITFHSSETLKNYVKKKIGYTQKAEMEKRQRDFTTYFNKYAYYSRAVFIPCLANIGVSGAMWEYKEPNKDIIAVEMESLRKWITHKNNISMGFNSGINIEKEIADEQNKNKLLIEKDMLKANMHLHYSKVIIDETINKPFLTLSGYTMFTGAPRLHQFCTYAEAARMPFANKEYIALQHMKNIKENGENTNKNNDGRFVDYLRTGNNYFNYPRIK